MLDRKHRLTRGSSFATTIRTGRRAGTPALVAHLARDGGTEPRVGLVVGKGVGSAVTRNLVKRRLRHLSRDRLAILPDGAVLVLRALPPAAQRSSAELAADLDSTLRRLVRSAR